MLNFTIKETGNTPVEVPKFIIMVGINNQLSLLDYSGVTEECGGILDEVKELISLQEDLDGCEYGIWECKLATEQFDMELGYEYESYIEPIKLLCSVDKVNELLAEHLSSTKNKTIKRRVVKS